MERRMYPSIKVSIPGPTRQAALRSTALAGAVALGAVGANAQNAGGLGAQGFSISVGDQVIAGAPPPYDPARAADLALARAQVDVRYDGLQLHRLLNVSTTDLRAAYVAGEQVTFRSSANYPAFIDRAEVRILDLSQRGKPVVARIPVAANGTAAWTMPTGGAGEYAYVLRVVDARGRYDETVPLTLTRTARHFASHETVGGPLIAAGEGEDRTAVRRIPVRGGMITASGRGATPGGTVKVMGEEVPVDGAGNFVTTRIVPAGDHVVTVESGGRRIERSVYVPQSEWFGVGIADVTAGVTLSQPAGDTETYVNGRAAFYVKGNTQGGWTITSSLDTREGPINEIFTRLNDKDPARVLDRLRTSDDIYPTYGDDSTWYDDTPTSGAIYLRAENDTTRFTWGNFETGIAGPGLLNSTRELYGAELRYASPGVTGNGDNRFVATLYAAQPDTLAQRDILRGTGGSVYFLTRQDITGGSTSVTVQAIDPDTGHVKQTSVLVEGVDYTVDHMQGVLMLREPLASSGGGGGLVSSGGGATEFNLVVQYEYTPTSVDPDSVVLGGRAEVWANDNLRLGATAMQERTGAGDQTMLGADLRWQFGSQSYAQFELARTDGPGISRSTSTDGGLTIASTGGAVAGAALGMSFDSYFDFADMGLGMPGHFSLWAERKEAGFSTLAEDITSDQTLVGAEAEVELSNRLRFALEGEHFSTAAGDLKRTLGARFAYDLTPQWTAEIGAERLDKTTPGDATQTGSRTDLGARLTWTRDDDLSVYVFGQATLTKTGGLSDNNRLGVGFDAQVSEKISVSGEISGGDTGTAGSARLTYAPSADNEIYLGYTLDPTRNGVAGGTNDNGTFVVGGRYRYSERLSTYAESIFDQPVGKWSVTNAFGVNYTPDDAWTVSGAVETGTVRDDVNGDFDRLAVSGGVAWSPSEDVSARVRLEYRSEDGIGVAQDRKTYGLSAGYSNAINENWRFIADVEALLSDSAVGDFHNGEYVRASLGFAYRPIANERFNMIARYSYLRDLPGEDQVSANGTTDGPQQISHVLSVAGSYDLNRTFTLGGKLGYRSSMVADRGTSAFTSNTAGLAALKLEWHVMHEWDAFGEVRGMWTPQTGTLETGAVLGVYRHLGEHAKIGLGYELGNVSDDLTNLNYQSQGLFLNIIGKF